MVLGPGTPLTVRVVAPPGSPSAWIRLVGAVDMTAEPDLAEAADRLRRLTVRLIVIDLAEVTFAGATLTHFLDTVRDAHPDAALVLRQPSPLIRRILTLTGQEQVMVMTGDPGSSATSPAGDLEHLLPAYHTGGGPRFSSTGAEPT